MAQTQPAMPSRSFGEAPGSYSQQATSYWPPAAGYFATLVIRDLLLGILFRLPGTRIAHPEAAVLIRNHFKIRPVVGAAFGVRNQSLGAIVLGIRSLGGVQHPQVLEPGALVHRLPRFRTPG